MSQELGFAIAVEEAKKSLAEGGAPIGACVVSKDGKVLGRGHNLRVQQNSPCLHAEISAFENANSVPASDYAGGTLYTTLSPCDICTGAAIFFRVSRVVIGESETYYGGNDYLRSKGIQVDDLASTECRDMVGKYIKEHPEVWYNDIGVSKENGRL